jgi:hypothetical protein
MEGIFPHVRANWSPTMGFRALHQGGGEADEGNLRAFLDACGAFEPRALRKDPRRNKKYNVLFWDESGTEEQAKRALTVDVSIGGLFCCAFDPPPEQSVVWVRLREVDERPFKVLVRRRREWGVAMCIPGFGGSFSALDHDLAKKLDASLALKE